MARAPKLKVFCTPAGFDDAYVAAPNQRSALKAWGSTTDLFKAGRAHEVEDPALQADALERPGEVIRRSRGDAAAMLGPEPRRERQNGSRSRQKPTRRRAPPDRSRLDAADNALAEAEQALRDALARLADERMAIERREAEIRTEADVRLQKLRRDRDGAKAIYDRELERRR